MVAYDHNFYKKYYIGCVSYLRILNKQVSETDLIVLR
jgi:hypothetical protein